MIIISQDGTTILNFDRVQKIKTYEYESCANIEAVFEDGVAELGMFKDGARAKEVLKDIIKAIDGKSFVEYDNSTLNIHSSKQDVFYMPKE